MVIAAMSEEASKAGYEGGRERNLDSSHMELASEREHKSEKACPHGRFFAWLFAWDFLIWISNVAGVFIFTGCHAVDFDLEDALQSAVLRAQTNQPPVFAFRFCFE